jgi:GH24 family phage-related lysozyme (muramidase)
MTIITTNPLFGNADYASNRWPILADLEGIVPTIYKDTKGYATIGVGFLISANVPGILQGIDPNLQANLGLSSNGYTNLVDAITNATATIVFSSNSAAQTAVQNAVIGVLDTASNYANNQVPQPVPSFTFQYSSNPTTAASQMQNTFDSIISGPGSYENLVDEWLNNRGQTTVSR